MNKSFAKIALAAAIALSANSLSHKIASSKAQHQIGGVVGFLATRSIDGAVEGAEVGGASGGVAGGIAGAIVGAGAGGGGAIRGRAGGAGVGGVFGWL